MMRFIRELSNMPKLSLANITSTLQPIFSRYPITFGYVFGSYATGDTGPLSDLDLAVYLDYKKAPGEKKRRQLVSDIRDDVSRALKIGENIDLICLNDATPFLLHEVVYKGKIIYNIDDGGRAHFEAQAMSKWLDWKWYDDQFNQAILENINKTVLDICQIKELFSS